MKQLSYGDLCETCAIGYYLPSNVCDHCNHPRKPKPITPRLIIGKDQMSGFAGLADGDIFGSTDGTVYQLTSGYNNWCLRPMDESGKVKWTECHPNFKGVDYQTFVSTVNSLLE